MVDPSLSLTIDASPVLVFSAVRDGSPLGLIDLLEPVYVPRTQYAQGATWLDGSFASSSTWDLSNIAATVELVYDTPANLKAGYTALVAALVRLSYNVTITKNSVATVYKTQGRAGLALAADTLSRWNLERVTEVYRLSIPVLPNPVTA